MSIQYIFEIMGTIVFAISGALAAGQDVGKNWFGILFVAFITAIGGGSLRDMLLGSYPLVWINDVNFIYAVLAGVILMRFFYPLFKKHHFGVVVFDAWGIALFTVLGTAITLDKGEHPVVAAIMGMFTAVMGGVMRDTLANTTPIIFRKEIYATACLIGAALFLILDYAGIGRTLNFIISGGFIVAFRLLSLQYKWYIPKFNIDYD